MTALLLAVGVAGLAAFLVLCVLIRSLGTAPRRRPAPVVQTRALPQRALPQRASSCPRCGGPLAITEPNPTDPSWLEGRAVCACGMRRGLITL